MEAVIWGRYVSLPTCSAHSFPGSSLTLEESRALGLVGLLERRSLVIVFSPPPPSRTATSGVRLEASWAHILLHSLDWVGEKEFPPTIQLPLHQS